MKFTGLNLRIKFIAGLVLFALSLGICISLIMYFHFNSVMQSEISQRSKMLLAQSNAVQDYVKSVLRPEMFEILPEHRFVLKAMSSSYISREVMSRLNTKDAPAYHYRRVSRNPRNEASAADEFESGLIDLFNRNRSLDLWQENSKVNGTEYYLTAKPVVFKKSCMNCHGEPENAPKELLEIYGDTGGFHHTVGEVGAVVVAGFPVNMIKNPVKELTFRYLGFYILGILFFALLISLFFDRLVMKNLQHLSRIFKTRFSGEQERRIISSLEKKDEIEGLIEGVDELSLCLSQARNDLEDHARNLEKRVEERTRDLDLKARKHHGDVRLFVELLSSFSGAMGVNELIVRLLESVGKRLEADQVVYHCTVFSGNRYVWRTDRSAHQLPEPAENLLWSDEILFEDRYLYIPVKSTESHWGIVSISWEIPPGRENHDPAILLALGQQVGILIENIQIFSNVKAQNDMLQSVFEGISDPLLLIDTDCRIIIANRGSRNILKTETRTSRQEELKTFLCSDRSPDGSCGLLYRVIEHGKPLSEQIRTEDGAYYRFDLYPLPGHDRGGGLRIVVYAREITMEKKMMEKMQQTERLSSIGKMAAGIAHEINNPMGVIQCYTDLVRDAVTDSETIEDIDMISRHVRNVRKIVQDLLNLSRPKQVISEQCGVNKVVNDAIKVFKIQGASRNIEVKADLEPGLPDVKCGPAELEQILTNIWLNAFDALQETGGRITIYTCSATKEGMVVMGVEDNGPGIPEHSLSRIFDPFYTTKEVGKGTGLGLSVVYGFVSELGGRIEVKSDDTTRFTMYFPAAGTEG